MGMIMHLIVSGGFTTLELMITLSILAILASVAVPSYQSMMVQSRLTTQTNELVTTLHFTRSEAIKRGSRVTICKSNTGASCTTGSNWHDGWIVFTDTGVSGTVDGTDQVLRVFPALRGSVLTSGGNFQNWFSYMPNGRALSGNFQNDTFRFCASTKRRDVVINGTGRPQIDKSVTTC